MARNPEEGKKTTQWQKILKKERKQ